MSELNKFVRIQKWLEQFVLKASIPIYIYPLLFVIVALLLAAVVFVSRSRYI